MHCYQKTHQDVQSSAECCPILMLRCKNRHRVMAAVTQLMCHAQHHLLLNHVTTLQSLLAEREKAFRAQAFALKQLNTRVVQLQQQHTEQASREAALLQELSCGVIQPQTSSAESLVAPSEQGVSLKRMHSCLPAGMETMRRRLEPMMSTGHAHAQPLYTSMLLN